MISAEQARKNVELHNSKVAAIKRQKAEEYIEKVLEPQIVDASMNGKSDVVVDIGECMEAISEVMGMIQEAGFKTERSRSDSAIRISWDAPGVATPHNTRAVVIVR